MHISYEIAELILVPAIGMMFRVFTNDPRETKIVLDAFLLNTQYYKVRIMCQ